MDAQEKCIVNMTCNAPGFDVGPVVGAPDLRSVADIITTAAVVPPVTTIKPTPQTVNVTDDVTTT